MGVGGGVCGRGVYERVRRGRERSSRGGEGRKEGSLGGAGDISESHSSGSQGAREHKPPHLILHRSVLVLR